MAIFTALAGVIAGSTLLAGTFLGTSAAIPWIAAGLTLATSIGVSYVMKALAGTPQEPATTDQFGTQGQLAAGGDVPRSFGLGQHMTAGSIVWANTWGEIAPGGTTTPNAYLTQVIVLGDLPGEQLLQVWVNGELGTFGTVNPTFGAPVLEYIKDGQEYLWVKYYNGTQTAADPLCMSYAASADRPYPATRVGTGLCYAVVTSLVEDKLFTGFPSFKFVLSGIPLYDPSKDDTNGGSGSHRYSNPATWGGDGDQLPAVQAYNILRGIRYNGAWFYGLQNMTGAARLPAANWNLQIAKCRDLISSTSGTEPTYRSGGQINIDAQPANAIEALLTACQGRLSEIGGFYKIHLGAPDSSTFDWTDADLLSSEQQVFKPFFSLADSVNGIQGTYPDPEQGWQTTTAPPLYRTDLEARDGNRRLMAAPSFDFVPYPEQVQRLQKSGIEESQRARTHVLPFPPAYWIVEPGDIGTWNSLRNGYIDKLFRVDQVTDRSNLDIIMNVTEVDPADYDWDHTVDYTGVATGPTVFPRPPPQGVIDWYAEGTVLYDADGLGRRVAIRISWDGTLPGVVGIQYEVRLAADLSHVTRGRSDQLAAGALLISQGLIPLTTYQVRGQYLPSSPRDMLWSDWLTVTTPEEPVADIPAWIGVQVTSVMDALNDRLLEVEQRISTVVSTLHQRTWFDLKDQRTQLTARSTAAFAEIERVETVAVDADTALASDIETLTATVGSNTAKITINATAIATLDGFAASQYSVTLDVNNYATGFELINGGPGVSATIFTTDKFLIASPGVGGGDPVPMFAVANVGGTTKVAIRGDVYATGTIAGSAIVTASLTATQIQADSITADRLVTGTITSDSGKIGALSVKSLSIGDNAVMVPMVTSFAGSVGGTVITIMSMNVSVDTTGLTGKAISVYAISTLHMPGLNNSFYSNHFLNINGVDVSSIGGASYKADIAVMSGAGTIIGTGGVITVPVSVRAAIQSTQSCTGTLYAQAAKR
jgi:hypothetical protein